MSDSPIRPHLSRWKRLKMLAVYYPTLAYNIGLGKVLRIRPWWNRVDDCVVLGALPFAADAKRLYEQEHVRGVVNTCMEYPGPRAAYERLGIEQFWTPTIDFTHPTIESVTDGVRFIARFAERGESVYVHCKAGRARSATIVACWLMFSQGMTPGEAQATISRARPHANRRLAERPVVQQYAERLAKSKAMESEDVPLPENLGSDSAEPPSLESPHNFAKKPQNGSPGQS